MKNIIKPVIALLVIIAILPALGEMDSSAQTKAPKDVNEYYDLMIFGVDRRPHQRKGRSDVIMIMHCEPGRITLFSIPRDTRVRVRRKMDKINHAYAYGGAELAKATIEQFLKFKVDNYIAVDFETFLNTVEVIKKLTDNGRLIGAENFLANADNLLDWLRFRGLPAGDRRRCQRHQLFIRRVLEYAQNMYLDQPVIFSHCIKTGLMTVDTDLTYTHAKRLFETYKNIDLEGDVERYVLPGYGKCHYKLDEETDKKKLTGWYYYPKYNWSLMTYIRWFRMYNMQLNYKETDTLRK